MGCGVAKVMCGVASVSGEWCSKVGVWRRKVGSVWLRVCGLSYLSWGVTYK